MSNWQRHAFAKYMKDKKHPSAGRNKRVNIVRLKMEWRNRIDCGIFKMRHMETYMGIGLSGGAHGLAHANAPYLYKIDN
ncbi:hypothetical protein Hanom_Chr01g00012311 [Helianthus anomalus]